MKGKRLLINTVLMTAASVFLRSLGLWFQVGLSRRMGAAGIGLYGLVASVGSLTATFAISGIRFATTRLVSEETGSGRNPAAVVRRCLMYAAVFGTLAAVILWGFSDIIALRLLGDIRTSAALRVLSLGMPFISTGAVLGGYFTGMCKAGRALMGTVSEELARMAVALMALAAIPTANVELMCAGVAAGSAAGEIFSFLILVALYLFDRDRRRGGLRTGSRLTGRMLGIAMPLAATAYARVTLNTVQNLLIPSGLRRSGASAQAALAGYGMIQGMVFPVITFPMVLFASLSELIVPELTEEQVRGNDGRIAASANMLLKTTFTFSAAVAAYLACFAGCLGQTLYESRQVGHYIALLAMLMPVMYMDNITDGMLRGLGEHLYSMRVNIIDSLLSTALIWLILPRLALYGYILVLYASEIFNFTLSLRRLSKITSIRASLTGMLPTAAGALAAGLITYLITRMTGGANGAVGLICGAVIFVTVYIILIRMSGAYEKGELKRLMDQVR